jgi:hypothetical protein
MTKEQLIDAQNDATFPNDEPQEGDEGYVAPETKDQVELDLVEEKKLADELINQS